MQVSRRGFLAGVFIRSVVGLARAGDQGTASVGPDLIVSKITLANYTCRSSVQGPGVPCVDPIDGTEVDAFAIGHVACNIGDAPVAEEDATNRHSVLRGGMFRLVDGRIEQIGTSWVEHNFLAGNLESNCTGECTNPIPGQSGYVLYPGCSNVSSGSINGSWSFVGPPSGINGYTGQFASMPPPFHGTQAIDARLQVHYDDLDPALNMGALYFFQAHKIASDDAAAGNGANNASYRRAVVSYDSLDDTYNAEISSTTRVESPAISAWKEFDPAVMQTNVQVPGEGLFIVAAKAADLGDGYWHYEYAVENLNSDRSAGAFAIAIESVVEVRNIGFHDVDYHSGEPYSRSDWTVTRDDGEIRWSTVPFDIDPNANALRWSTLYNFRFDADAPPSAVEARLELYKPGVPASLGLEITGPFPCSYCPNGLDSDHDGEKDCSDLCPNTPIGGCKCQGIGICCLACAGMCWVDYPRDGCVNNGTPVDGQGVPDQCGDPRCKNGCPLLDMDNDGDRDLADFAGLQRCFGGSSAPFGQECLNRLDLNDNGAIDLSDYKRLFELDLLGQ